MKYTLFSAALLAALLLFCIGSASYVSHTTGTAEALVQQSSDAYRSGAQELALHYLENASDHWTSRQTFCGIVLKHDEIDDISGEFARLCSFAKTGDDEEFLSGCEALRSTLRHIREMEWPLLQNIL